MKSCVHLATAKKSQLGGMIIESMVGLLILGIIGGGILHTTARVANAQRDLAVNNIVVNQMRSMLTSRSSSTGSLCTGNHSLTLPKQTSATAITVRGCAQANMTITGIQIGGSALGAQTVSAIQPLVLEIGQGNELLLVGGQGNTNGVN